MRALLTIVTLALSLPATLAQTGDVEAQPWQQCGGITWKGFTTCTKGYVCHEYNEYYSQCIPTPVLTSTSTTSFPADTITPTPTTTTAGPVTTTTGTGCGPWRAMMPRSTGPAIRASDGWAAGLYLQKSATLGPASSRGWFLPSNSIRLIAGDCPRYLFLNIHEAAISYKPLAFEVAMTTDTWRIAPGTGIIGTTTGADTFVACSDGALYLQTGSQLPTGNCTTTHLATAYN